MKELHARVIVKTDEGSRARSKSVIGGGGGASTKISFLPPQGSASSKKCVNFQDSTIAADE